MIGLKPMMIFVVLLELYIIATDFADVWKYTEKTTNEEIKSASAVASGAGILCGFLLIPIIYAKRQNNLKLTTKNPTTDLSPRDIELNIDNTILRVAEFLFCLGIIIVSILFLHDKVTDPYQEKIIMKNDRVYIIIEGLLAVLGIIIIISL